MAKNTSKSNLAASVAAMATNNNGKKGRMMANSPWKTVQVKKLFP